MERLRPRDEEWAWAVRQRRDSDFWVSGLGLMSERGEIESEITREAVGRELQSSKQRVLHKFYYFYYNFGLIQSRFQPDPTLFGLFQPVSTVNQYDPIWPKSAWINASWQESKNERKKKNQRSTNTRSATSRTAHGAVSGTGAGAAALEPHSCFLAYQMQHCKLYGFFVS